MQKYQIATDWISCGARKSRAILTCADPKMLEGAKGFYQSTTRNGQPTLDRRMDRAIRLQKEFGVSCQHEYDPA